LAEVLGLFSVTLSIIGTPMILGITTHGTMAIIHGTMAMPTILIGGILGEDLELIMDMVLVMVPTEDIMTDTITPITRNQKELREE
jgi:hypothetical protein